MNINFNFYKNTYNNIIYVISKYNINSIILVLNSNYDGLILFKKIVKWFICINKNNNTYCNLCNNCLKKNTDNVNNNYIILNLDYKNESEIYNLYKYIYQYKKILIYINTSNINFKYLIIISKYLNKKNILFIFKILKLENFNLYILNKSYKIYISNLDKKKIFNFLKKKFFINKIEMKIINNLEKKSIFNIFNIIKKFKNKRNELFYNINFFLKEKKIDNLFNFFLQNKEDFILKLFILIIIDVIYFKLNIKLKFNKDKFRLIYKLSKKMNIDSLFIILNNFIIYDKYYLDINSYIKNNILLYNILLLDKYIFKTKND
ncbi:DNA polymerase III delta prime subunit [endosymbiont of Euscepes postfasciatus]|uniref:DNA polymerase III subunit delta' C-terminal domain-containing protein n=1 Tax=endosymbiont of Euscepes postfasciatus TaxID=650377 RepID=UPI000DC74045|nr:DNA polymerase III subunit delta' C-terminal domain-containing protein [endosymbiont of Euscepes postfasciatus]BBA84634.1 DNA polymerase III delta prime subunit [endosymbiont of Euscepes postfasciatus]